MDKLEEHIWSNQKFHSLVQRRNRFMWILFGLTMVIFVSYTLLVTFAPALLGIPLWSGAATKIGIPIGFAVMIIPFMLTGIYVYRANREFDQSTLEILNEARKAGNEKK